MQQRIPLVHLCLLKPFRSEIEQCGVDPDLVLRSVGLSEQLLDEPGSAVHPMVVYQFLENAAVATNDPFLGAKVGRTINLSGWAMLQYAETNALTVGNYLSIFVGQSNKVASSVTCYLNIRGDQTILGETRVFAPNIVPAQTDAFMACLSLAIIRRRVGEPFDPGQVSVIICDPDVLPAEYDAFHALRGDCMGYRLKFPTAWLTGKLDVQATSDMSATDGLSTPPDDFRTAFRKILKNHVGSGHLTAEDAAALVSMSRATLASRLALYGTSISAEIQDMCHAHAVEALTHSTRPVADIATSLGYNNPTSFTRAFRRVTGMTPPAYRSQFKVS